MKVILLSLLVGLSVLLPASVLCEESTQRQVRSIRGSGADAPAERLAFLRGKTPKAAIGQSRKGPVRRTGVEMSGVSGIQRLVPQQYSTIQAGIDASVHGDTVLVSEGTYFENIKYRGKRIVVASLYLLDQDTSHISKTVIDGSQAAGDTGSVVCFVAGEDTNSVLCGFTIRNGFGTYITDWDEVDGGGVFLWESGGRLVRNVITGNNVYGPNAWGAGVSMTGLANTGQTLLLEDNIIRSNAVTATAGTGFGGGVSIHNSQFNLTGNVFEYGAVYGVAEAAAGAVLVFNSSGAASIQGNVFLSNQVFGDSLAGGCLILINTGTVAVDGNIFEDNVATSVHTSAIGGGLVVQEEDALFPEKTVTRNIFRRNQSVGTNGYAYAGAIWNVTASAVIAENMILDNQADAPLSCQGGGIYGVSWGGAIANNIITGNIAKYGGGIGHTAVPPSGITQVIVNNTVSHNTAEFGGGFYGGSNTTSILLNNILWDDSSSTGEIYSQSTATIEAYYSNIEGWDGGTGNIDLNPLFADTLYRLGDASPCIGAGRDSVQIAGIWYHAPPGDFMDNSRPMPVLSQPDIGAWENALGIPTGVEDGGSDLPEVFELLQNYPNPFNPKTIIGFKIHSSGFASLKVYDLVGREVASLVNGELKPGSYEVPFDANGLASGVYFYRFSAGRYSAIRKLVLVR